MMPLETRSCGSMSKVVGRSRNLVVSDVCTTRARTLPKGAMMRGRLLNANMSDGQSCLWIGRDVPRRRPFPGGAPRSSCTGDLLTAFGRALKAVLAVTARRSWGRSSTKDPTSVEIAGPRICAPSQWAVIRGERTGRQSEDDGMSVDVRRRLDRGSEAAVRLSPCAAGERLAFVSRRQMGVDRSKREALGPRAANGPDCWRLAALPVASTFMGGLDCLFKD